MKQLLLCACQYGRVDIVRRRLDSGLDSNDGEEQTPLYLAAASGDCATMNLLRAHGAKIGNVGTSERYRNEVSVAAVHGHTAAVDLLIFWGSRIDSESMREDVHRMLVSGNAMGARCLVSRGLNMA